MPKYLCNPPMATKKRKCRKLKNMINRGVDVFSNYSLQRPVLSNVIKEAKQEGIKVLAYDRMINNADIDFFIFLSTMKKSVKCRPRAPVDKVPQGNYFPDGRLAGG